MATNPLLLEPIADAEPKFTLCIRACGGLTSRGTGKRCRDCIRAEARARLSAIPLEAFGPLNDEERWGRICRFCGNRAAICRCG